MPAPEYNQETRDRAVRMHQERRIRAHPGESAIECRRQIGALIDVNSETLRVWIERAEDDAGARPGTTNNEHAELNRSRREVGELRRGIDILRTPAAFSQRRSSTANSSDLRLHWNVIGFVDTVRRRGRECL